MSAIPFPLGSGDIARIIAGSVTDYTTAVEVLRGRLAHDWTDVIPHDMRDMYEQCWAAAFVDCVMQLGRPATKPAEDDYEFAEPFLHRLGDITISFGFGKDAVPVTFRDAEWAELESGWQLGGWIREIPLDHWGLYEADQIFVCYNPWSDGDRGQLGETVNLVHHAGAGKRYGDSRGAYTKFLTAKRPRRLGGEV